MPRRGSLLLAVAGLGVSALTSAAHGATITFNNEIRDAGTGFGNVLGVLALQDKSKHNAPGYGQEYGAVTWNGRKDVRTGEAKGNAGTRTRSVAELASLGINGTNLGVIFNLNEPGNAQDVLLYTFTLVFQSGSGATLFTATYNAPAGGLLLDESKQGTGDSGFLFRVQMSAAEAAFFDASTNRIGAFVPVDSPITNVAGGSDNFYLADPPPPGVPLTTVPVPAALWAGLSLLSTLGLGRALRLR